MTETLLATVAVDAPLIGPRLSSAGGAAISGGDLSRPLSPGFREAILAAFRDHHILIFRDQDLSRDEQLTFTRQFGEIEEHVARHSAAARYGLVHTVTNLGDDGQPTTKLTAVGNYHWHTDKSYHALPSLMTVLHAKELPPEGGDTQFANMAMAYEALPDVTKQRIAGRHAIHSWAASRRRAGASPPSDVEMCERPPVNHPLVRTHPETGARTLYIGNHASHILGMPEAEGEALLLDLLEHDAAAIRLHPPVARGRSGDVGQSLSVASGARQLRFNKAASGAASHRSDRHRAILIRVAGRLR